VAVVMPTGFPLERCYRITLKLIEETYVDGELEATGVGADDVLEVLVLERPHASRAFGSRQFRQAQAGGYRGRTAANELPSRGSDPRAG